jgi:MFS family permease
MVLPLIALTLTSSPALVAGVRVAQTAAGLLFGLVAGVLVDRFDRRRLMMGAELVRGFAMLALAAAALLGGLALPMVFAAAFLIGTAETVTETAAQALVPMVVERNQLRKANGRIYGTQTVMNDFVGAPLGAALLGLATVVALAVPAGLYLAGAIALTALVGRFSVPRPEARSSMRRDMADGLRALWSDGNLRRLALYGAVTNGTNMAFFAVFVVFAVGAHAPMHLTNFGFSLLLIAAAAGATIGSACADRIGRLLRPRVLLTAVLVALAVCFGTPAVTANPVAVAAALVVSGFLTACGSVLQVSLRQSLVPPELIGRISAGSRLLALAARPVGALTGGVVAALLSPARLFAILSVVVLVAVPLSLRVADAPAEAD